MGETLTQYKHHLWLSAEPEQDVVPATTTTTGPLPRVSEHYDSEVIIRSPTNITLDVTVRVGGKAPGPAFTVTLSACKCSLLSDLRAHIVVRGSRDARLQETTTLPPCGDGGDSSLLRRIRDLRRVTFRLEEDGHVARLNITPTRIDASCVFPETEYEAWYYRNILRGNQRVYAVEVNIEA
ncbi:uncharacterized protein PV07_05223 [Cladophialophora immunda]|uniref:Uncharacterized protein n=1 Tax=Cladophialophora immunda TaxID=569365 RepID=A0A0D2AVW3_9EURO|nr:uncharacterized protein PV07_05223 [Cladophialophora immunda]KIW29407.1 hypothetical protein PV07_05223 [Cladophialophora immunda]